MASREVSETMLRRVTLGGRRATDPRPAAGAGSADAGAPGAAGGLDREWAPGRDRAARRALFDALAPGGEWTTGPGQERIATLADALDLLERVPLASAGLFPGDLVRRLMDLPGEAWYGEPALYARYQAVVRAGALARRDAPEQVRQAFWRELPARLPSTGG